MSERVSNDTRDVEVVEAVAHNLPPRFSADPLIDTIVSSRHFADNDPGCRSKGARESEMSEHGVDTMRVLVDIFDQQDFAGAVQRIPCANAVGQETEAAAGHQPDRKSVV